MDIVCLDLEGVLVPEIWIAFSEAAGSVFILRDLLHAEDTFVFFPSAFTVL